jgi:hypothetical protein
MTDGRPPVNGKRVKPEKTRRTRKGKPAARKASGTDEKIAARQLYAQKLAQRGGNGNGTK